LPITLSSLAQRRCRPSCARVGLVVDGTQCYYEKLMLNKYKLWKTQKEM
jgi:hypothetical protein